MRRTILVFLLSTALLAGNGWRKPTRQALDRHSASDVPVIVYLGEGKFVTVAYVIKEWNDKGDELPLTFREMGSGNPIPWKDVTRWQPLPKPPTK